MKNYKFIVPIVLVVLFIVSIYMLYDAKASTKQKYEQFLVEARESRELGVVIDAETAYQSALSVTPSLKLYVEIGEFYKDAGQTKKAIDWGHNILTNYPKKVEGYEFLMNMYVERSDYAACFDLYNTFQKRKLSSKTIDKLIASIEFEYFFNCEYVDVGIFSSGLCPVQLAEKWGYVNQTGNRIIECKFKSAGHHSVDLAPVVDAENDVYFIDGNGNKKKVVEGVKDVKQLGFIENGIYSLFDGKTWGFYNDDSKHVFGKYDEVSSIGNGIAAVKNGKKWTLVDRDGKDISGKAYDGVVMDEKSVVYRNDRIFVYDNLSYYMIDSSGKKISDQSYEDAKVFNDTTYAAVKIKGEWGFVDKEGKVVIEPEYEDARSFNNGFAAVKFAGKWGFINPEGKLVIECDFDDSKDFNGSGAVFVKQDDVWRLLRLFKYNF